MAGLSSSISSTISFDEQKFLQSWAKRVSPVHGFRQLGNTALLILSAMTGIHMADNAHTPNPKPCFSVNPVIAIDSFKKAFRATQEWKQAQKSKTHRIEKKSWIAVRTSLAALTLTGKFLLTALSSNLSVLRLLGISAALFPPIALAALAVRAVSSTVECLYYLRHTNKAKKKKTAPNLLDDRLKKYCAVESQLKSLPLESIDDRDRLNHQKERLLNEIEALTFVANSPDNLDTVTRSSATKAQRISEAQGILKDSGRVCSVGKKQLYQAITKNLIQKQTQKVTFNKRKASLHLLTGLAAFTAFLAIVTAVCPPASIALALVSGACTLATARYKAKEVWNERKDEKMVQACLISEAEKRAIPDSPIKAALDSTRLLKAQLDHERQPALIKKAQENYQKAAQELKALVVDSVVREKLNLSADQDPSNFCSSTQKEQIFLNHCREQNQPLKASQHSDPLPVPGLPSPSPSNSPGRSISPPNLKTHSSPNLPSK